MIFYYNSFYNNQYNTNLVYIPYMQGGQEPQVPGGASASLLFTKQPQTQEWGTKHKNSLR